MSYVLVNGGDPVQTMRMTHWFKGQLEKETEQSVTIVQDFGSNNPAVQALREELENGSTSLTKSVSMLMTMRRSLVRDLILPLRKRNELVLYVGGVLDDEQWFNRYPDYSFEQMLRENQEMLQALGGVAYPRGALYVNALGVSPRPYLKKLDLLKNSMANLKTHSTTISKEAVTALKAMF